MSNKIADNSLSESSPSVQSHLGILQNVIQRMATNSSSAKAWCITIVSAVLVIVADKNKPDFAFIALIPTTLFLALDTYYLALEKGFRASYTSFVKKLHSSKLKANDLYSVVPEGKHRIDALKSFSVWGFYTTLIILILLARILVLG